MTTAVMVPEIQHAAGAPRRSVWRATWSQAGAVWLSMLVLGLGFGIVVVESGFPIWVAPVTSALVFAGSVEFLLIGMMAAGAPLSAIALTTVFTNARHLAYGLTHPVELIQGRWRTLKRGYAIYGMCDETYALTAALPAERRSASSLLLTTAGNRVGWILGSTLGALVGAQWLRGLPGVDFVMTGLFIVLAMDAWAHTTDWRIRSTALLSMAVAAAVARGQFIIVALAIFVVLALGQYWWQCCADGKRQSSQ